jgi:hypothetical protein
VDKRANSLISCIGFCRNDFEKVAASGNLILIRCKMRREIEISSMREVIYRILQIDRERRESFNLLDMD